MKRSINQIVPIAIGLMVLFMGYVNAQNNSANSHPEKLPWVKGQLPKKSGSFDYLVSQGEAKTLRDARDDSFNSLLIDLGNKAGVSVNSQTQSEIKSDLKYKSNAESYEESSSMTNTYKIERDNFKASFTKVSEYYELVNNGTGNLYQLWELYEVSNTGKDFKPIIPQYTTIYGSQALLRSAILPGWGQFYKKRSVKGIAILSSEIGLAIGTVYSEMKRSDNFRKSQETTNMEIVKEYRRRADAWELNRNIFLGGVAGVYIYNLLDAALAKGQIKYAWIPQNMELVASTDKGIQYYGIAFNF